MTGDEAQHIHERFDRFDEKLDRIAEAVTRQVAVCEPSRARLDALCRTVYGNGREGMIRQIERLETVRSIRSRGFWALVSVVSAVVSGVILLAANTLAAWVKG